MPKHRSPASDASETGDREQSRAFIEAARGLGCEENLGRLDEMVRRVARLPPQPREAPRRGARVRKKDQPPE